MKKRGVVRVLYGDLLTERRVKRRIWAPDYYFMILHDVRRCISAKEQSDLVCCWGIENYKYCKFLRLRNVLLMDRNPFYYEIEEYRMEPRKYASTKRNHFIHKFLAAKKGLEEFDSIMQVDWDTVQVRPLTEQFWEKQESYGVPFRAPLGFARNKLFQCSWREDPKDVPYGIHAGCFWLGSSEFLEGCTKLCEENRHMMPEIAISKYFDDINGGWIGKEKFIQLGYAADFFRWSRAKTLYPRPSKETTTYLK